MITLIEARNYRCLRSVSQPLGPFQLLVGPNATGKLTLLDVPRFLSRLTTDGLPAAISERSANVYDLFWQRSGEGFELAVEVAIPEETRKSHSSGFDTLRYEVAIAVSADTNESIISAERGFLKKSADSCLGDADAGERRSVVTPLDEIIAFSDASRCTRLVLTKGGESNGPLSPHIQLSGDVFFDETDVELDAPLRFHLGERKSALGNLPEDESRFPAATWFKQFLSKELTPYQLDSKQLHAASPFGLNKALLPNAANLPWVIADFKETQPAAFRDWVAHLQVALPDLANIRAVLREDDRHRYLMLEYGGGLRVPSWFVSEGTLRLIALTLPAYLKDWRGTLLIEEPENGLHPLAIEMAYQSLSSVYDAQVLMATHSPLLVGLAKPSEVLCFTKDTEGATQIVSGDCHPRLADWQGEVDLGTLFASGVLG